MMTPNGDARAGLFDIHFQLLGGIRGNILRHHARTGRQQRFRGGQQAAHVLQLPEQGVPMLADTAQFNIKTFGVSCFQAYFLRVLSVMRAGVLRRVPSEARDQKSDNNAEYAVLQAMSRKNRVRLRQPAPERCLFARNLQKIIDRSLLL